jgi:hypothetical protein
MMIRLQLSRLQEGKINHLKTPERTDAYATSTAFATPHILHKHAKELRDIGTAACWTKLPKHVPVGDSKRAVTSASVESAGSTVMMLLMLLPSCRSVARCVNRKNKTLHVAS